MELLASGADLGDLWLRSNEQIQKKALPEHNSADGDDDQEED
jgi:hypothetical protein